MKYLGLMMAGALLCGCQVESTLHEDNIKTIAVTGVGEVQVMPDLFVVSGAIIKKNETSKTAMNEVAEVVNSMQGFMSGSGELTQSDFNFASVNTVGVKDPDCLLFNEEADRTNNTLRKGERRVKRKICNDVAQQSSLTFTFTGGPPEKAGFALSRFSESGAIRLKLDGYRVENLEEIELQAGELAVKNAREKADRIAAAAGTTVSGVLDLNGFNTTYNQGQTRQTYVNTSGAGEILQNREDRDPVEVTDMQLEAGPQTVSASIQLEFIYE
ncbi:MAG: SIMPL domain-containing protein [Maricaulaceae bacterium]